MQSDLIADDEKRHFVFIDFINTIHHKNFEVILENDLRASYKKKEEMSDLIATILLISKESIIRVELTSMLASNSKNQARFYAIQSSDYRHLEI
jgi:hypothetical protein